MFEYTSRYYSLETVTFSLPDGREVRYARRRFLPRAEDMPLLAEVTVTEGDRLDMIAFRTLGDPLQFWRVCDANNAMNPVELTAVPGRKLRIATPQA
jgi:hypothetical protein